MYLFSALVKCSKLHAQHCCQQRLCKKTDVRCTGMDRKIVPKNALPTCVSHMQRLEAHLKGCPGAYNGFFMTYSTYTCMEGKNFFDLVLVSP